MMKKPLYGNQGLLWRAWERAVQRKHPGAGWGPDVVRSVDDVWREYAIVYRFNHEATTNRSNFTKVLQAVVDRGHLEMVEMDGETWVMLPKEDW